MKRRISSLLLAAAILAALPASADEPAERVRESVSAERVVVDVRVIDNQGAPVTGLGVSDFFLRVDGRPVSIESVEWISSGAPGAASAAREPAGTSPGEPTAPPAGRLVVLFFQTDFEPSRITGQMRMIRQALSFLDTCSPEDRLAVLSFDSRLKLRQDFTSDRGKLRRAIVRTLYADNSPDPPAGSFPSLASSLDFRAARKASLPEHALRIIGQGLAALPGSKSLLFFGWGIGNFDSMMGLILDHNYALARAALLRSHTSVFVLDVTTADFHSMEGGLEAIAGDTGGLYVKTHVFPQFAMQKVARAISGEYVLSFVRPPLERGRHEMSIRVPGHRWAAVLARPDYVD
ncbi:MAG: VWA domain-containing protein [Thermoanaerobaculia bacterium]